jgi:MoxR-like ATPase
MTLYPVITPQAFVALQHIVATLHLAPEIARYIALIAFATRTHESLRLGVSTRGSLALVRAAQAHAACDGRHYVVPDDVKATAAAVLTHRLVPSAQAEVRGTTATAILSEVLDSVRVPAMSGAAS